MVHVKAHSASIRNNPSLLDFCYLMSLKHGNSLLLNQRIKNGLTIAVNLRVSALGNLRRWLGFFRLPDKSHFYLMGQSLPWLQG